MKILVTIMLIVITLAANGQDFDDRIITNEGDTIKCKITLVNNTHIFFEFKAKKKTKNTFVAISKVFSYTMQGNTIEGKQLFEKEVPKTLKDSVKVIGSNLSLAGEELIKAKRSLSAGFTLSVGASLVAGLGIQKSNDIYLIAGTGMALVGILLYLKGIDHIGAAGVELKSIDNTTLLLKPTNNGIGLALSF